MSRAALVTGGTGGIGSVIVRRLRADGYAVVFCGRDEAGGQALERVTGAVFQRADATDRSACDASVAFALERLGTIDLLVAGAGVLVAGPLATTSDEQFDLLVEINLTSAFRYGRALFAPMRAQGGGAMVRIASDSAIRGSHRIPAYSVVKAAVVAIAELLGAEGAPHGIRANAICRATRCRAWLATTPLAGGRRRAFSLLRAWGVLGGPGLRLRPRRPHRARGLRRTHGLCGLGRVHHAVDRVAHDRARVGRAQRVGDLDERVVVAQSALELALELGHALLRLTGVLAGGAGDLRQLRGAEDEQDDHCEHEQVDRILESHRASVPSAAWAACVFSL
jgi:meso-butanediol dehydrogenase / (S,S)-butanediol dehydrogenase / diacetyl reductase